MSERLPSGPTSITDRQLEVARLVAEGQSNAEIAQTLGISVDGAKYHVSELLTRLRFTRRREIVEWYAARPRRGFGGWGWWPWVAGAAGLGVAAVAVTVAVTIGSTRTVEPVAPGLSVAPTSLAEGPSPIPTGRAVALDDGGLVAGTGYTLTLLGDGTVLITGGEHFETPGGRNVSSAIVRYDPSDDSFVEIGELLEARTGHTATLLPDGRVLFIGGDSGEVRRVPAEVGDRPVAAPGGVETFDPTTGVSTAGPALPELLIGDPPTPLELPFAGHTATLESDGQVLIVGPSVLSVAVRYDPGAAAFGEPFMPLMPDADYADYAAILAAVYGGSPLARDEIEAGRDRPAEAPPPGTQDDAVVATPRPVDTPRPAVRDEQGSDIAPCREPRFVSRLITQLADGGTLLMSLAVDEAERLRPPNRDEEMLLRPSVDHQFAIEGLVRLWYVLDPSDGAVCQLGDPVPFELETGIPLTAELAPLADRNALVIAGMRTEPCDTALSCSVITGGVWFVDAFDGATTPIEPTVAAHASPVMLRLADGSVLVTGVSVTTGDEPAPGPIVERYYLE